MDGSIMGDTHEEKRSRKKTKKVEGKKGGGEEEGGGGSNSCNMDEWMVTRGLQLLLRA